MNGIRDDCLYLRIEYLEVNLESNGNPYIVTDYIPTGNDIKVETKFSFLGYDNNAQYTPWYAAYTGENNEMYRIIRNSSNSNSVIIQNGGNANAQVIFNVYKDTTYNIVLDKTKGNINGNEFTTPYNYPASNTTPIKIFAYPTGTGIERSVYGRFYFFKVSKADKVVLDLIPVRIGTEGFMYDRISHKLFGNSGTGKFILGPDIGKPYDVEVEYLEVAEGYGAPGIILPYIPNGNKVDLFIDFNLISWGTSSNYRLLFGSYTENKKSYIIQRNNNLDSYNILWGTTNTRDATITGLNKRIQLQINGEERTYIVNGIEDKLLHDYNTSVNTAQFTIAGMELSTSNPYSHPSWRLYSLKITDNGEVLFDLVPVRIDNEGCLYNKVNGEIYKNYIEDTHFVIGPDVN